jgi:hypothetical protein
VTINISPLCGDDSVHILQRTNRRTYEAKPLLSMDDSSAFGEALYMRNSARLSLAEGIKE